MTQQLSPRLETPSDRPGTSATVAAAHVRALTKLYGNGDTAVRALDDVTASFTAGQFTAIMGPSGSGKSTLMHVLAGLDTPTQGYVELAGVEISGMSDTALTVLRREKVGFIFQAYNLLPTLTALDNITLPLKIAGRRPDPVWLDTVIDTIGLRARLRHRPHELSGGQQQRVAAARALASRPAVVFADEPTGALDSQAAGELLRFLRAAVHDLDQTIVMVTHDPVAASYADRVVFLADGRIVHELTSPTPEKVLDLMKSLGG